MPNGLVGLVATSFAVYLETVWRAVDAGAISREAGEAFITDAVNVLGPLVAKGQISGAIEVLARAAEALARQVEADTDAAKQIIWEGIFPQYPNSLRN
jgi:hypothetical protein